jgi:hypothetical protein
VEFSHQYERKDHSTLEFRIVLPPRGKVDMMMNYRLLNVFAEGPYTQYNVVGR